MEKTLKRNFLPILIGLLLGRLLHSFMPNDIPTTVRYYVIALLVIASVVYIGINGYRRIKNRTLASFTKGFIMVAVPFGLIVATVIISFHGPLDTDLRLRNALPCFVPVALAIAWISISKKYIIVKNRKDPAFAEGFNTAYKSSTIALAISFVVIVLFITTNIPL